MTWDKTVLLAAFRCNGIQLTADEDNTLCSLRPPISFYNQTNSFFSPFFVCKNKVNPK